MQVTIYTKPDCHLCEDALDLLDRLSRQHNLQIEEVNILEDMALYEAYHDKIPVVQAGDGRLGRLVAPITETEMAAYLEMARRLERYGTPSVVYQERESIFDRVASYIGRHWLRLACVALGIFVGLPWLAPVFAALGWWSLADPIYTVYAFTCHQLPERAGMVMDYQVAFCYRNTALYGGLFLFGTVFGLSRSGQIPWLRWLKKPLPWWGLVLMLLPMAVDGVTHMLGLRETVMSDPSFDPFFVGSQVGSLNWWLRIITGGMAALGAVWFAYPRMQRAVEESEALREFYRQSALTGLRAEP
jgi:uncharacterized membrane protein/glutaredoxin